MSRDPWGEDESRKRFMLLLGASPETAALLAAQGYSSVEEIAYVPIDELLSVPGLSGEIVSVLREGATNHLLLQATNFGKKDGG